MLQNKILEIFRSLSKNTLCAIVFYDHTAFSKGTVFLSDDLTVCTIPENLTIDNDSSNQGSID